MEYGQKVAWWLFIVTVVGVLIALSEYIFPWSNFLLRNKAVYSPAVKNSIPLQKVSNVTSPKPIPNVFYTKDQVAEHNTVDNCWFILSSQVYDLSPLTRAYKQIPNINQLCGNDVTGLVSPLFKQYGIKDSSQLTSVLGQYAVGKVK